MSLPSTIQSFATIVPVNLSSVRKTFTLPVASTNQGRILIFKDAFGNASTSSLALSTTGADILERSTTTGVFLNTNFGAWSLTNDGINRWFLLDVFENTLFKNLQFTTTVAYTYTGGNQTFTAPAGVTQIGVFLWGAGGGGNAGGNGGAGAMVQGILSVSPGASYTIIVGQGGTITAATAYGGGGAGTNPANGTSAQGGGRSAIQFSSADLVTAGGGGGCGYSAGSGGAATFSGTANAGNNGTVAPISTGGGGGTQSAGGAGGTGPTGTGGNGSLYTGGNGAGAGAIGGGGGGGGYYGGGGAGGGGSAGGSTNSGGGGGGGSSLINNLSLIPGQTVFGFNSSNGVAAPNSTSPFYAAGVGAGGATSNGAGGHGRVVIRY